MWSAFSDISSPQESSSREREMDIHKSDTQAPVSQTKFTFANIAATCGSQSEVFWQKGPQVKDIEMQTANSSTNNNSFVNNSSLASVPLSSVPSLPNHQPHKRVLSETKISPPPGYTFPQLSDIRPPPGLNIPPFSGLSDFYALKQNSPPQLPLSSLPPFLSLTSNMAVQKLKTQSFANGNTLASQNILMQNNASKGPTESMNQNAVKYNCSVANVNSVLSNGNHSQDESQKSSKIIRPFLSQAKNSSELQPFMNLNSGSPSSLQNYTRIQETTTDMKKLRYGVYENVIGELRKRDLCTSLSTTSIAVENVDRETLTDDKVDDISQENVPDHWDDNLSDDVEEEKTGQTKTTGEEAQNGNLSESEKNQPIRQHEPSSKASNSISPWDVEIARQREISAKLSMRNTRANKAYETEYINYSDGKDHLQRNNELPSRISSLKSVWDIEPDDLLTGQKENSNKSDHRSERSFGRNFLFDSFANLALKDEDKLKIKSDSYTQTSMAGQKENSSESDHQSEKSWGRDYFMFDSFANLALKDREVLKTKTNNKMQTCMEDTGHQLNKKIKKWTVLYPQHSKVDKNGQRKIEGKKKIFQSTSPSKFDGPYKNTFSSRANDIKRDFKVDRLEKTSVHSTIPKSDVFARDCLAKETADVYYKKKVISKEQLREIVRNPFIFSSQKMSECKFNSAQDVHENGSSKDLRIFSSFDKEERWCDESVDQSSQHTKNFLKARSEYENGVDNLSDKKNGLLNIEDGRSDQIISKDKVIEPSKFVERIMLQPIRRPKTSTQCMQNAMAMSTQQLSRPTATPKPKSKESWTEQFSFEDSKSENILQNARTESHCLHTSYIPLLTHENKDKPRRKLYNPSALLQNALSQIKEERGLAFRGHESDTNKTQ